MTAPISSQNIHMIMVGLLTAMVLQDQAESAFPGMSVTPCTNAESQQRLAPIGIAHDIAA